jgi:hypothetical protein
MILVGYGASTHGAVDRHLGVLAGARGEAAKSAALTQSAERLEAGLRRGT